MSHVYRVTYTGPQSVLVKAESRGHAKAFASRHVGLERLDATALLDAVEAGERIHPAEVESPVSVSVTSETDLGE